jgi:hypothetical protein
LSLTANVVRKVPRTWRDVVDAEAGLGDAGRDLDPDQLDRGRAGAGRGLEPIEGGVDVDGEAGAIVVDDPALEIEVGVDGRAIDLGLEPGQGGGGSGAIDPHRQGAGAGQRRDRVGAGPARGVGQLGRVDGDPELAPGDGALVADRGQLDRARQGALDRAGQLGVVAGDRGLGRRGARRRRLARQRVAAEQRAAGHEHAGGQA